MDKETKKKIKNMVLTLREMFENEIENRLNYYGIYRDKAWKDGRSLRYLSSEELSNKKRVEAFIKRQESAGLSQSQATVEFIKEASYTWINRLIGLKCMETRGLIDEEVITVREEFGGRSERHRNFVVMEHPELANTPDGGLIPCLMDVFRDVTEEIKILFDPENEYSLIVPRYRSLKDAIDLINKSVDYDVYKEDELLGWVYQYFQTKEKDRIFEEVYKKKKKISGSDIIPVTSLYTEKYMVRFLVENSLGAIWMEMYPDSELYTNWEYFVEDRNKTTREPRPIKDIKFLDPASGSGHFLLYAFDLFYQMYKEEGVVPEKDIPNYILKYNLHGIDIDLRSVQISALSLWMKAKSKNRDIKIEQMNLVAANAIMVDSDILDEFLEEFGDDALAKELVTTIWHGLQNVRELGSLLKVEEQIDAVIERVKGQTMVGVDWGKEQFSWERWKQRILDKLREYYERAAETFDINKQMFANETIKGLSFIDLVSQKYDVVATNPPYMGNKTMHKKLGTYLGSIYSKNSFDLYASFIDRNMSFSSTHGLIAMITQQTFMFNEYFEYLRGLLISKCHIRNLAHLGPGAFEDITGAKVNTAMFILQKGAPVGKSIFLRLLFHEKKEEAIKDILANPNVSREVFEINQNDFKHVALKPFVYNFSENILNYYKRKQYLKIHIDTVYGVITRNNDKYLRFNWEVGENNKRWVDCEKKASGMKYFDSILFKLDFSDPAVDNYGSHMPREEQWFKEGIVFGIVGSYFGAKYLPKGFMIEHAVHLIIPNNSEDTMLMLGLLNSKFAKYILDSINPSYNYGINDINRIPYSKDISSVSAPIFTGHCVSIKKSLLQFVINDREFKQPAILWSWENVKGGDVK